MNFNTHSELEGKHAPLSPSKISWGNYDEPTLVQRYISSFAPEVGTILHDFARKLIDNRMKLTEQDKKMMIFQLLDKGIPGFVVNDLDSSTIFTTVKTYVNDAIGFRMSPEILLKYSDYCFGTTDAISFNDKQKFLRIHDLKTGGTPTHMEQLERYAALFCLEYNFQPSDIQTELRIYQSQDIVISTPDPKVIFDTMNLIITDSAILEKLETGKLR